MVPYNPPFRDIINLGKRIFKEKGYISSTNKILSLPYTFGMLQAELKLLNNKMCQHFITYATKSVP